MKWKLLSAMDPSEFRELHNRIAIAYENYPDVGASDDVLDELEDDVLTDTEDRIADEIDISIPEDIARPFFSDQVREAYLDKIGGPAFEEALRDLNSRLYWMEDQAPEWEDYVSVMMRGAEELIEDVGEVKGMHRWADGTTDIPRATSASSCTIAAATRELMHRMSYAEWAQLQGKERENPFSL